MNLHLVLFPKVLLALLAMAALMAAQTSKTPDWRAIHDSAIVIDTHADTPSRFVDEDFDMATVHPISQGHMDFEKVRAGNLGAEFFSIYVAPRFKSLGYSHRALDMIDSVDEQARLHPDQMVMA